MSTSFSFILECIWKYYNETNERDLKTILISLQHNNKVFNNRCLGLDPLNQPSGVKTLNTGYLRSRLPILDIKYNYNKNN